MNSSIKNALTKTGHKIRSNADIIATGSALIGFGLTIYFVIKETPEAMRLTDNLYDAIERIDNDIYDPEENKVAKRRAKVLYTRDLCLNYSPAIVSALVTGGSMIFSNSWSRGQNAAITGTLNATNLAFQEYREYMRNEIGVKKEQEVHDDIRERHMAISTLPPDDSIIDTGNGKTLCYIELDQGNPDSGIYFWSSPEAVEAARNEANAEGVNCNWVSMADLLYFLKINVRKSGYNLSNKGWTIYSREDLIDFRKDSHIHPKNGQPCLDIYFYNPPQYS